MTIDKQKIAYFVADTVVAGVTKKLAEKALFTIAPSMEDREMLSNMITGTVSIVVTSNLENSSHRVADRVMNKIAAVKAKKKTDTTTD